MTGTVSSLSNHFTTDSLQEASEGAKQIFISLRLELEVQASAVTDSGGDGSLSYDSSTGVVTYTGPSAAETRAHLIG